MRDLEAARYAADRAFRQYDAADPANRLVAGELEARWNKALARVAEVEGKIAAHDAATPAAAVDPASLGVLAPNLKAVWSAPTTDARLKKRIVRTVIQEVVADIDRCGVRDRSPRPLDRRRSQRDAPAQAAARAAQQHLSRHRRRRAPTGADRQRRSDRRHPEPERAATPATAIAGRASASPRCARITASRCIKPAEDGIEPWLNLSNAAQAPQGRAQDAQAGGGSRRDRGHSSLAGRSLDLQPRRSRIISRASHHRTRAAEPKIPHGIASRSAKPLLFNDIDRWVL